MLSASFVYHRHRDLRATGTRTSLTPVYLSDGMQFGRFRGADARIARPAKRDVPRQVLSEEGAALRAGRHEFDDDGFYPILHVLLGLCLCDSEHCEHEQVDEELLEPQQQHSDRILVSLRHSAHWYSAEQFSAKQMLRESGKFDFSKLNFYMFIETDFI